MAKKSEEQQIVDFRFFVQRVKLDVYEEKTLRAFEMRGNSMFDQLKAGLVKIASVGATRTGQVSMKEIKAALKAAEDEIKIYGESLAVDAAKIIGEAGEFSFQDTNKILSWDGRLPGYRAVTMSANQIAALTLTKEFAGRTLPEWLAGVFDDYKSEIDKTIELSKKGFGYDKMLAELVKLNQPEGTKLKGKARQDVETIMKSYIQSTNALAHKAIYDKNPNLISGVEWSAIMENGNTKTGRGTCPRCQALDGQVYPTVEDGPACPLHARCRCMYLPVIKPWSQIPGLEKYGLEGFDDLGFEKENLVYERNLELKSRPSLGEFRARYGKDYSEWWKTKPKAWQDKAIGPTRAELVRQGLVDFKDIVDKEGNLIPIKDLKLKGTPPAPKKSTPPKSTPPATSKKPPASPVDLSSVHLFQKSGPHDTTTLSDYEKILATLPADQVAIIAKRPKPNIVQNPPDGKKGFLEFAIRKMVANPLHRAGDTVLHEYGHNIDWEGTKLLSDTPEFRAAMVKDAKALGIHGPRARKGPSQVDRQPAMRKIKDKINNAIIRDLEGKVIPEGDYPLGGYSDIIDAITDGEFYDNYLMFGHGKAYYKAHASRKMSETFANMFESRKYPDKWKMMKEDFPETVKEFEKLLKELGQ